MDASVLQTAAIVAPPLVLAITLHEAAHGYVAGACGDPTARMLGRVTLNPVRHIDPVGTVLLPLLLSFSGLLFGWAKPVPVNFANLRRPRLDAVLVSMAGPASNLAQALLWGAAIVLIRLAYGIPEAGDLATAGFAGKLVVPVFLMARVGVEANFWLGIFNMLPILPLDGGRVTHALLPAGPAAAYAKIERFGILIVLGIFIFFPERVAFLRYPVAWFLGLLTG